MPAYNFTIGRPQIVPTQLATDATMRIKLPQIRERGLTEFKMVQGGAAYDGPTAVPAELPETASHAQRFITESKVLKGDLLAIAETNDWKRMFDNYVVLWQKASGDKNAYGFQHFLLNSVIVTGAAILFQLIIGGAAGTRWPISFRSASAAGLRCSSSRRS